MQKLSWKAWTAVHVFLYRLTGGRFGSEMRGFKVLLLTTTGRKSGKRRTTPLGYFEHDGGYVIIASNGGLPSNPGWYYNLKANPRVDVQIKDRRMTVRAEQVSSEAHAALWKKLISIAPGYDAYPKRTTREIPLILLRPVA